jgi:hypothetical protein
VGEQRRLDAFDLVAIQLSVLMAMVFHVAPTKLLPSDERLSHHSLWVSLVTIALSSIILPLRTVASAFRPNKSPS